MSSKQRTRVVIYAAASTANRRPSSESTERQLAACRAAAEAAGYEIVGSFPDEAGQRLASGTRPAGGVIP